MDYLQYLDSPVNLPKLLDCFKPYYKWITFNTERERKVDSIIGVLNLIINGLPSIPLPKG